LKTTQIFAPISRTKLRKHQSKSHQNKIPRLLNCLYFTNVSATNFQIKPESTTNQRPSQTLAQIDFTQKLEVDLSHNGQIPKVWRNFARATTAHDSRQVFIKSRVDGSFVGGNWKWEKF
jgi:hypothetical protein